MMNKELNLMTHAGNSRVEREAVASVLTPEPTATWTPIPHETLIELVEETLATVNLKVVQQVHSLNPAGSRYFGMFQVANGQNSPDYGWVLGLRNSHDKTFPAGLVAGSGVFVCDNLAFSGEVKFARKHTLRIMSDLPGLASRAVGRLMEKWHSQDTRIETYKNAELRDIDANDIVVRALDARAITTTQLPKVLAEYRRPSHEEFSPRTAWSLFNSFTEVMKGTSLNEFPARTERLHGLFDIATNVPKEAVVIHGNN
jgi:hypothetical protein